MVNLFSALRSKGSEKKWELLSSGESHHWPFIRLSQDKDFVSVVRKAKNAGGSFGKKKDK